MKLISLFSGIGGLDEGLHQSGFTPIFCSELDRYARETLELYLQDNGLTPLVNSDINLVDPVLLSSNPDFSDIDLLAGGPPCQSYSLIGARKSVEDSRGALIFKMVEFAEALSPKVVLLEQVKGLLSAALPGQPKGSVLGLLVRQFQEIGYDVTYKLINMADYGVPQLRERVFLVASKYGEFSFPEPTHISLSAIEKSSTQMELFSRDPHLTIREVISFLPDPPHKKSGLDPLDESHLDITPARDKERIHGVPEGCWLSNQFQLPQSQRMRLCPKKDTTKFRRLAWDKPSLTLRGGEAFYHPEVDRYLTPREYALIHTFSADRRLSGPIRGRCGSHKNLDQHRQVANAVPPLMAKILGESIKIHIHAHSCIIDEVA